MWYYKPKTTDCLTCCIKYSHKVKIQTMFPQSLPLFWPNLNGFKISLITFDVYWLFLFKRWMTQHFMEIRLKEFILKS